MAGSSGSQLAQLKRQVKEAGITDRRQDSNAAKKRKRGQQAAEKDQAAHRRAALEKIKLDTSLNPFDEKVTRQKHDVLGRKVKGAVGRPGLAKQGGLAQRTATLLPEYQNRNRSSTFIDRRFGESDATMTPEERMLERFTREKQKGAGGGGKGKKAALFSLNDEEGQEEELTHFGRSLSGMGPLPMLGDEDDGAGQIDGSTTAADHFGGFEAEAEGSGSHKSKADVMREVMAKSKMHKMERQQMRDADDELRAQLDDELGDIRGLLMQAPKPPASASAPQPETSTSTSAAGGTSNYDAFVRELAFERRAKPQDRLKTEEEVAEEEAEELRKAEASRLKRMRGEADDGDDERAAGSRAKRPAQGDDLEDDFVDGDGQTAADIYGLGSGLGEEEEEEDDGGEESEEDDDESEEEQDEALEVDGYGEAIEGGEDDDGDDGGVGESSLAGASKATSKRKAATPASLPFTFPCPATHDEFLAILETNSVALEQVPVVIKRIRALHHASLAEDNKFKLQAFIGVLLDHALYEARAASIATDPTSARKHSALVDALLGPLFELSTTYPRASAHHYVTKISLMERNLTRGLSRGATKAETRTWPGAAELALLRIAGLIWPTSDLNHAVTTPLMLLEAHYLAHCRVRSHADLAACLFLVSLVVQQQAGEAKRMVPEAINAVTNALLLLLPLAKRKQRSKATEICRRYAVPTPDFGEEHAQGLAASESSSPRKADLFALLDGRVTGQEAAQDLLNVALSLVVSLSTLYEGTLAYIELFEPIRALLVLAELDTPARSHLETRLQSAQASRRPITLHAHRAVPLASFIPKFDEGGRGSRRYDGGHGHGNSDPDAERAQAQKLRALVRKEKKGAVRELRRDAQFLAQHRAEEKRKEADEYRGKMGKIVAALGEERSEEKRREREKERMVKKRKGGR